MWVFLLLVFRAPVMEAADLKETEFFETHVRPLLIEYCLECHTTEKHKGNLRLDTLQGILKGGDTGPAVVPGNPEGSLMIEAIQYTTSDLQMPPKKKLGRRAIERLSQWIAMGVPWPGESSHSIDTSSKHPSSGEEAGERHALSVDEDYWAFQPLPAQITPTLDDLIALRLKEEQLTPNPEASRRTLIRRAYFDLIGLPPSHAEITSFETDERPDALERMIDRLLSMPGYGERWGRHWLDVVRFAQSNGYERDDEKPEAWRYRDYVIKSFNEDKPYDQFVKEQLAGDEMPETGDEGVVATGFYRLGVYDDEPDDKRAAEFDGLDDMLRTSSETFLGVTVGCARCHDHMFDPIAQREYYELLAFFRNAKPYPEGLLEIADGKAMAMTEHGPEPKETFVLVRGNAGRPSVQVEPRFPNFLGGGKPSPVPTERSTGLRLAFAEWMMVEASSLAARVMANRVWQYHFGKGIVTTPNDFGRSGHPPSNMRLLDMLAAELVNGGWSIKHLHRVVMNSKAWRRSSVTNARNASMDPDNRFLWRQNMRRLEAETMRDAMLHVAGALNRGNRAEKGFFPAVNGEVVAGGSRPGRGWGWSSEAEQNQRSVYAFVKRTMVYPFFEIFDYTNTESSLGVRPVTTVAPQALLMLNGAFVHACAERIALNCLEEERPVHAAFLQTLARAPDEDEVQMAKTYLAKQTSHYAGRSGHLRFVPDYASALFDGYQAALPAHQFLKGPRNAGWEYFKGKWEGKYEGIINSRLDAPPFVLAQGQAVDWELRGQFKMETSNVSVGLLLRGTVDDDVYEGYECRIDAAQEEIALLLHQKDQGITLLARADLPLADKATVNFAVSIRDQTLEATIHDTRLEAENTTFSDAGRVGVTSVGGAVIFTQLMASADGRPMNLNGPIDQIRRGASAQGRAFHDFCNLLLNLNAFVYVD